MTDEHAKPKGQKEQFARFFEDPSRPTLRDLLQNNFGEFDHLDFKSQWPEERSHLARDVLGFANSGGGALVVGVEERPDGSLDPIGLTSIVDKSQVSDKIKKYLPDDLHWETLDFSFDETEYGRIKDKRFQVLLVHDWPMSSPFVCIADGIVIKSGGIYVRVGTATVTANHVQLQKILNRRIETMHSTRREITLREHLDELKVLYDAIPARVPGQLLLAARGAEFILTNPNPYCPKESMDAFVSRMVNVKQDVIEKWLRQMTR